jgi:hypothetical protein
MRPYRIDPWPWIIMGSAVGGVSCIVPAVSNWRALTGGWHRGRPSAPWLIGPFRISPRAWHAENHATLLLKQPVCVERL